MAGRKRRRFTAEFKAVYGGVQGSGGPGGDA